MEMTRGFVGVVMILLGILLFWLSFVSSFFLIIYGLIILVLGVVILMNEKEDTIEQIIKKGDVKI